MLIKSPIEEKEALKNFKWVFYSMSRTHLFKKGKVWQEVWQKN